MKPYKIPLLGKEPAVSGDVSLTSEISDSSETIVTKVENVLVLPCPPEILLPDIQFGADVEKSLENQGIRDAGRHPLEVRWDCPWHVILDAIDVSGALTRRGVRGIVAERQFKNLVLSQLSGWDVFPGVVETEDYVLRRGDERVSIQVKNQRMTKGIPLVKDGYWIVEAQKTQGPPATRLYKRTDFDILAVSLWPATHDWSRFMYASIFDLAAAKRRPRSIAIFHSVPVLPNNVWTDQLDHCIERVLGKHAVRQTQMQFSLDENPPSEPE